MYGIPDRSFATDIDRKPRPLGAEGCNVQVKIPKDAQLVVDAEGKTALTWAKVDTRDGDPQFGMVRFYLRLEESELPPQQAATVQAVITGAGMEDGIHDGRTAGDPWNYLILSLSAEPALYEIRVVPGSDYQKVGDMRWLFFVDIEGYGKGNIFLKPIKAP